MAETIKLSITTSQQAVLDVLKQQGHKPSAKQLILTKNTQTDDLLKAAEDSNNFDSAFRTEMKDELTHYQATVKKAHDSTSKASTKQILKTAYDQASLLLTQ